MENPAYDLQMMRPELYYSRDEVEVRRGLRSDPVKDIERRLK
jgi:hypothetical protein